ncbi:exonuclease SbcCD subunit D [Methanobrevibacter sp.]|uniref:metallophosphoesterase family protein n=1 Tax=Methanobrevibacter sp. TaxID=66852 RepID=UPI00388EA22C
MRFAHLADTHLGHRQYGIFEREEDYYEVFERTVDRIIEEKVDFVIHSGDLFDSARPSTNALLAFQRGLLKLNDAGIRVYAIAGNHDSVLRKNVKPPIDIFEEIGLKIIRLGEAFQEDDIFICGVPYVPKSQRDGLLKILEILSKEAQNHEKSILVLHQGLDKTLPADAYELDLDELPENFDYYALGHIHNYFEEDYGKGKLVYPGSMEMYKLNENFEAYGKGFCIVDINETVTVERIKIDLPRMYFKEVIDFNNFESDLERISEKLSQFEVKPMMDLLVKGGDFDAAEVYEVIQEAIGDKVLNLRPVFKPGKVLEDEDAIDSDRIFDPKTLLHERLQEKYGNAEITSLSLDLLDYLSSKRMDDAKEVANDYYIQHYRLEEGE